MVKSPSLMGRLRTAYFIFRFQKGVIHIKLSFAPPKYTSSVKEFAVYDSSKKVFGKMNRYSDNFFLHTIGRHVTRRAVQHIHIKNTTKEITYQLKARNKVKNSIYAADFLIYKNDREIGSASEAKIGNTLHFAMNGHTYKAHSPVTRFRELNFYAVEDEEELFIGRAERQNPVDTTTVVTVHKEKTTLDPLLFAGLTWLHRSLK
ncbi:MAG: hypothetical protein EA344_11520 [Alkalicoccus sp.]|uniref:Tubby C-terminal domain-containing protein n=1 Tax=Alkalicoccus sp. TaxID=2005376 RepID=A0A651DIK0_9BACI|nr:MAG: hypothetical protein EA344_11520 [Alkalicoccus sp.]